MKDTIDLFVMSNDNVPPTEEEMLRMLALQRNMQLVMESCATKSALSGVMGGVLGFGMGAFFSNMGGASMASASKLN